MIDDEYITWVSELSDEQLEILVEINRNFLEEEGFINIEENYGTIRDQDL